MVPSLLYGKDISSILTVVNTSIHGLGGGGGGGASGSSGAGSSGAGYSGTGSAGASS